jgi:hypothetical protein
MAGRPSVLTPDTLVPVGVLVGTFVAAWYGAAIVSDLQHKAQDHEKEITALQAVAADCSRELSSLSLKFARYCKEPSYEIPIRRSPRR